MTRWRIEDGLAVAHCSSQWDAIHTQNHVHSLCEKRVEQDLHKVVVRFCPTYECLVGDCKMSEEDAQILHDTRQAEAVSKLLTLGYIVEIEEGTLYPTTFYIG